MSDEKLRKSWKELYSEGHYFVQNSYEWIFLWWKHFRKKSRRLYIVAVEEDEHIVGIGPFLIEKHILYDDLKFIGSGLTDFHEILAREKDAEAIISHILDFIEKNPNFDIANLEQISRSSPLFEILKNRELFQSREMVKCQIIYLNVNSWEEYRKKLKKKFRGEWNRKLNKLSREGDLNFEKHGFDEKDREIIKSIFLLHRNNYKKTGKYNKLMQKSIREFITEFILELREVQIFSLSLNEELVAYLIGFFQNDVYYSWNSAFNSKYRSYSPGILLRGLVIQYLIEAGIKKVNFMRGEYEYKKHWLVDGDMIPNFQFLAKTSPLRGNLGVKYLMTWKWIGKKALKGVLKISSVQKIMFKRKH